MSFYQIRKRAKYEALVDLATITKPEPAVDVGECFEEVTMVSSDGHGYELMVHLGKHTRKVLRMYTYVDMLEENPGLYAPSRRGKWTWEPGQNAVFKHLVTDDYAQALRCFRARGFVQ